MQRLPFWRRLAAIRCLAQRAPSASRAAFSAADVLVARARRARRGLSRSERQPPLAGAAVSPSAAPLRPPKFAAGGGIAETHKPELSPRSVAIEGHRRRWPAGGEHSAPRAATPFAEMAAEAIGEEESDAASASEGA